MEKERRRFERIECLLNVKYNSKKDQINGYSFTKDVSEGGIGLPVSGKIPTETRLDITVMLNKVGQTDILVGAKVVWSRKNVEHWKSRYSAGLKFLDIEPADKEKLLKYVKEHRWIKTDFERSLEENKVPVLGGRGEFLI